MKVLIAAGLVAILVPCMLAQNPAASADPEPTLPEIEAVRGPYLKTVADIHTARDTRTAGITHSYIANLDRLQRDNTAAGDLKGALAVNTESERIAAHKEPTEDEKKAMPAKLLALRRAYEKERDPIVAEARKEEERQTQTYMAALDSLQRRLTTQNQLGKALAVKKVIGAILDESRAEGFVGKWHMEIKEAGVVDVTILPDRTCVIEKDGLTGKWAFEDGWFMIEWANGFMHRFSPEVTGDKRPAEEKAANGTTWMKRLTYIRIKNDEAKQLKR